MYFNVYDCHGFRKPSVQADSHDEAIQKAKCIANPCPMVESEEDIQKRKFEMLRAVVQGVQND